MQQKHTTPSARQAWLVAAALTMACTGDAGVPERTVSLDGPFLKASPASVGIDPAGLDRLAATVREFVASDQVVGADLLVIKDRRTVLHNAYGWADREAGQAMTGDAIVNLRSMTKPIGATVIQRLIDEGRLALDDPVSRYFPAFDHGLAAHITIEHLLHHTAGYEQGLPEGMATWTGSSRFESLRQVAEYWGRRGPVHEPGAGFRYADAHADILGGVAEVITGRPAGELIDAWVLSPLGMSDTLIELSPSPRQLRRYAPRYSGSAGQWTKRWTVADGEPYPFCMFAQGLYGTAQDFARFLTLWLDGGEVAGTRILSPEAIDRALQPVSTGTRLEASGFHMAWGHQWALAQVDSGSGPGDVVAFGHGGSDGTLAFAFPDLDLIVIYLTQSRGNPTGGPFTDALMNELVLPLLANP